MESMGVSKMKIEVTKSIDQNGKVIRAYVDYGDFCKMQSEYEEQIDKMKNDQKTAFIKGMRHFAKAMKNYDRTEGAWTDYFEHTVDIVLTKELAKQKH